MTRPLARAKSGSVLALSALMTFALAGCPAPKPPADGAHAATVKPAELPSDPAALIQYADAEYAKQTPEAIANAVSALEKAMKTKPSFDAEWRLARAYSWLSEDATDDKEKAENATRGIDYAKQAVAAKPDRVEGHYYLGTTLGQYAYVKKLKAKNLVPQVLAEAKAAVKADEKFDHAGPLRLLGALYAQAPEPPTSVGDHEEGQSLLKRASDEASDYPQNHLLLGDAYVVNRQLDDAEKQYKEVLDAPENPAWSRQLKRWRKQAQEGLKRVTSLRRQESTQRGEGDPF
jgi:hypothetical protein